MTNDISAEAEELKKQYQLRFTPLEAYRKAVWEVLVGNFFQLFIKEQDAVLDLGCGWGEFINQIKAGRKYGMDLNSASPVHLEPEVKFLWQDCSMPWEVPDGSLDIVFTSNFFEHLPSKSSLAKTLSFAFKALKPGGRIICMGPNIKFIPGAYWDFFDHHVALTELSLKEGLELSGFKVEKCLARFLPYTMVGGNQPPLWVVRLYLKLPWVWNWFGKQFLVVGQKRNGSDNSS